MRPRARILLSIAASLALAAAGVLLVLASLQRDIQAEMAHGFVYAEIRRKIHSLNLSIARFPVQPHPTATRQIRSVQRTLDALLQAMDPGDPVETALVRQLRANARELRYSIEKRVSISSDPRGTGFPERCREHIFRIFQRLHTEREFQGPGSGSPSSKKPSTEWTGPFRWPRRRAAAARSSSACRSPGVGRAPAEGAAKAFPSRRHRFRRTRAF